VITRACGAGVVKVGVLAGSFVSSSIQTVTLPGFTSNVVTAKDSQIEVRFTSSKERVTATLKMRITGNGLKDDCDIDVDKKSETNDDSDDSDESANADNNGDRAGD